MSVGVLLLAAGVSRRFGADKRLASLPGGERLLVASVARAVASGLPVRVCLRSGDDEARAILDGSGATLVECPGAEQGMGRTLAQGAARLPPWEGVLVALGDMPWIEPDTFGAVAAALAPDGICQPFFRGRPGHPVGFGRAYFPALARLDGDQGARELILAHAGSLVRLDVPDGGVVRDVDRESDLCR